MEVQLVPGTGHLERFGTLVFFLFLDLEFLRVHLPSWDF